MPLRNDLLNPISADKPAGDNLRYAPIYDKIKDARREDDDAPQGEWKHERKVADWPLTIKLVSEALATKTKDLQLAAWLAEAMLIREGVAGLREVLDLIRGYLESYWEGLYPELEDGDAEYRAAPLEWIGDRLEMPVKRVPLTRKGLNWLQYKESRAIGSEESADTDEKRQARLDAIADGKIPQEQFDKDFDETPKKFYVGLLESFDAAMESVAALGQVCDEKFGDVTPSFGTLKRALEEVRQTVYILLQAKREKEPDEPVGAAAEPEAAVQEAPAESTAGAAAAPAPARAQRPGPLSAEPADRDDAIARVVSAAKYLRQQDPYSPAPYLMLRGLRWGELRAAGGTIDQTALAAPSSEHRQTLKRMLLDANWTELLETAERAMGMECGRGWLDLQRYVGRACYEMGSYYDPIRNAVISELRALLSDYPQLPELTMMDDTATANAETLAWLKENVTLAPAQGTSYAPTAFEHDVEPEPGTPAPPDTFELAMQAARSGRAQDGIEMLMREMVQERSGRARFHRKVQLTQLCVSTGHQAVAFPILQELAAEIERRKLEDWESPELLAQPLALLYGCLARGDGSPEERQKLYSWICRLDPLQAMSIAK
ncbi:MAG TPA: type VI secretion system protein TssA [Candidatus Acidoferrales bacterium]|nr:type VI secretion system protein TssA [Candidatus Acidoferrales bacterium]